jgi:hypothetical protein
VPVFPDEPWKELSKRGTKAAPDISLKPKGEKDIIFTLPNESSEDQPSKLVLEFPGAEQLPFKQVTVTVKDQAPVPLDVRENRSSGAFESEVHKFTLPGGKETKVTVHLKNETKVEAKLNVQLHWHSNKHTINLHVMTVGVSVYANPSGFSNLAAPCEDAAKLRDAFLDLKGKLFDRVEAPVPLCNQDASHKGIIRGLSKFVAQVRQDRSRAKLAVVFLAGHGASVDDRYFVFVPHDYDRDDDSTYLYYDEVKFRLERLGCPVLLILDSCYSGRAVMQLAARGEPEEYETHYPVSGGIMVLAASQPDQLAREGNRGLLTQAILEVLSGTARNVPGDEAEKAISLKDLEGYVLRRVAELARKGGAKQRPMLGTGANIDPNRIPIAFRPIPRGG